MSRRIEIKQPCPHKILQRGLDGLDLSILELALRGEKHVSIAKTLKIHERTVRERLRRLEMKKVIEEGRQEVPLVDSVALWEYVFVTYLKLHLSAAVLPAPEKVVEIGQVHPTPPPPGWLGILDKLREGNPLYDKLVRCAFVLTGTEYDAILLITTQSRDEYAEFCSILQQKGFIEKVWGSMAVEWAGYTWNPLAVPDPTEVRQSMSSASDSLLSALRKRQTSIGGADVEKSSEE
jgi:DNA-binding Lrp family transcriptional regulator